MEARGNAKVLLIKGRDKIWGRDREKGGRQGYGGESVRCGRKFYVAGNIC